MTTTSKEHSTRTYFGWQHEKVAFLFGMSAQRVAMIAGAVLAAIWPLASSRMQAGALLWPVALILVGLAFVRIGGRTMDEWALAFVSYHVNRSRTRHKFLSAAFAPDAVADKTAPKPLDLPGILAPIKIMQASGPNGGPLAVAYHRLDRTYTGWPGSATPGSAWSTPPAVISGSPGGVGCCPGCAPKAIRSLECRRCSASFRNLGRHYGAGTPITSPTVPPSRPSR